MNENMRRYLFDSMFAKSKNGKIIKKKLTYLNVVELMRDK